LINGTVTSDGEPVIVLPVAGERWPSIIDTGFNGDLELPESLRPIVNARFKGRYRSLLAGGQIIEEDTYRVVFPFDGQTVTAEATFVTAGEILVGTHLIRRYRLEIDFPNRKVLLERTV
jgi:predicted aspartyl protease